MRGRNALVIIDLTESFVRESVEAGSAIFSDELLSYDGLSE